MFLFQCFIEATTSLLKRWHGKWARAKIARRLVVVCIVVAGLALLSRLCITLAHILLIPFNIFGFLFYFLLLFHVYFRLIILAINFSGFRKAGIYYVLCCWCRCVFAWIYISFQLFGVIASFVLFLFSFWFIFRFADSGN